MVDKALVIGGAGSIGSNLVTELIREGYQVLVVDNLSSGRHENLLENTEFVYCDIYDRDKIENVIVNFSPNYIFNLAAHFANQNSVDFPFEDIKTNIVGQINVLEACKKIKFLKKYIYASSSCVYGHVDNMSEDSAIYPYETPYAINKYSAELYTKYYSQQFNIPTVSVRIFNTFGEGELAGKYRNVIPNFIDKAIKNETIYITGDGSETRDFTYVKDTVNCLVLSANSQYNNGEVFNSGTGIETEIDALAKEIIKLCESKSKIEYIPSRSWDGVKSRVSNVENSINYLGYKPKFTVSEALYNTVEWYKSTVK